MAHHRETVVPDGMARFITAGKASGTGKARPRVSPGARDNGGQSQQAQNHQTHDVWQDGISALAPMASPPDDISGKLDCGIETSESYGLSTVVEHVFTGYAIQTQAVERAIALTEEKYCGAGAMHGKAAKVTYVFRVLEGARESSSIITSGGDIPLSRSERNHTLYFTLDKNDTATLM